MAFLKDGGTAAVLASTTSSLLNISSSPLSPGTGNYINALIIQLQRLSSWFHSSLHVEDTLKDWNDLTQFIIVWADFCKWRHRNGLTVTDATDIDSNNLTEWTLSD